MVSPFSADPLIETNGETGRAGQRRELSDSLPRIALFLFEVESQQALLQTLERIPASARDRLEEVVVMEEGRQSPRLVAMMYCSPHYCQPPREP